MPGFSALFESAYAALVGAQSAPSGAHKTNFSSPDSLYQQFQEMFSGSGAKSQQATKIEVPQTASVVQKHVGGVSTSF